MATTTPQHDPVNAPTHYMLIPEIGLELIHVRDVLLDKLDGEASARAIDYWSRSWEYMSRWMDKNGIEDLKKAQWYLNRLIEQLEEDGYGSPPPEVQ